MNEVNNLPQYEVRCSAKGCARSAVWAINWRNPKIHSPDRVKVWVACEDHRESLSRFVDLRGFLLEVVPLDTLER